MKNTNKMNLISTYRKSMVTTVAAAVLATSLLMPTNASAEQPAPVSFSDLENTHWAYPSIEKIVKMELVSGYEDGTYKPEGQVTRAEFATFLSRIFEGEERTESKFVDITADHWAKDAIEEGIALGYINEEDFANGEFNPDKPMTRIEIAKWFANGLMKANSEYVQVLDELSSQNARLPYKEAIQGDSKAYVGLMLGTGLMTGYNGYFNPTNNTSRAEVATMMVRYMDAIEKGPDSYEKLKELREIANNPRPTFTDLTEAHWSYNNVQTAIDKGYVSGYPDGTFRPDQVVAHSEFMKMLVASFGHEVGAATGKWYEPYVQVAKDNGYITADDVTATPWAGQMTREDVAKRAAQALGLPMKYPKKAMYQAVSKGIIQGVDAKGTLKEKATLTRAQAITIIERIHQVKAGETLPVDKRALSQAEVLYHRTNMFTMFSHVLNPKAVDAFQDNIFSRSYSNGAYTDETVGMYIIDLADPNDPYRHLLNGAVYGRNSESIFNAKEGYAMVYKTKATVTSNPLNLEMFQAGYTFILLGNSKGTLGIRWTQPSALINLSETSSAAIEVLAGEYVPLKNVQQPESIGVYEYDSMQFGGFTAKEHYLKFIH